MWCRLVVLDPFLTQGFYTQAAYCYDYPQCLHMMSAFACDHVHARPYHSTPCAPHYPAHPCLHVLPLFSPPPLPLWHPVCLDFPTLQASLSSIHPPNSAIIGDTIEVAAIIGYTTEEAAIIGYPIEKAAIFGYTLEEAVTIGYTIEEAPFQRHHWGNFWEMWWKAYGFFPAHRYRGIYTHLLTAVYWKNLRAFLNSWEKFGY